jgi:hypothetical protein
MSSWKSVKPVAPSAKSRNISRALTAILKNGKYSSILAKVNANINLNISPGLQGDLREGMDACFNLTVKLGGHKPHDWVARAALS